ncbi:nuclear transport factor 2 family protein [Xenorhabdus sp. SGI246]|uniref:nuclear transport factor 2 family protein n=1 Tax=Xenorhabdus sp. SGI246 TaxID=3158263 RepID=UPI00349F7507
MSYSNIVINSLKRILENNDVNNSTIEEYFPKNYVQVVNGNEFNFNDFISHINLLKETLISTKVNILSIAEKENNVHTHHIVKAIKKDGEHVEFEVFARFLINESKIIRCYELNRKISGSEQDDDLGSRK